jgi:hypothetical protein
MTILLNCKRANFPRFVINFHPVFLNHLTVFCGTLNSAQDMILGVFLKNFTMKLHITKEMSVP